ncbi:MAG: hypothetical protein KGN00_00380 [Chloroflexota bacterium]|nr:hypothetical protein [Chloroflexota bacterium]MDE3192117.1 hypothetical protein [Chloroflexota bacterium]
MVAVVLGMKARARLEKGRPGCGACDIDAPEGPDGSRRLLVALVAGSEAEGRLLDRPRRWRASTEDAKAMVELLGDLGRPGAAEKLAEARREAARLVREPRVWRAVEAVAGQLTARHAVGDAAIREAIRTR